MSHLQLLMTTKLSPSASWTLSEQNAEIWNFRGGKLVCYALNDCQELTGNDADVVGNDKKEQQCGSNVSVCQIPVWINKRSHI